MAFRAAATATGNNFALTIAKPTGTATGDLLLAVIGIKVAFGINSAPSGWTLLDTVVANSQHACVVYWKLAGGSEPANYTWSIGQNSWDEGSGLIAAYSGIDQTTPIEAYTKFATTHASFRALSVTTLTAGATLVALNGSGEWGYSNSTTTAPSGYTQRAQALTSENGGAYLADKVQAAAGASGDATFGATNFFFVGTFHLSLKPAGAGGTAISVSDTGAGADSLAQVRVSLSMADSGAGAEAFGGRASLAQVDAGAGSDALAQLRAAVALSDAGAGVDGQTVSVTLSVADSGAGADAAALAVLLALAETGAAVDGLALITETVKALLDAGAGADLVGVAAGLGVEDAGAGADGAGVSVSLSLADAGAGADGLLTAMLMALADVAAGADVLGAVTVNVAVADGAQAADALGQVAAALAVLDAGAGVDVTVRFDAMVRIVSVVFALAARRVAFGWAVRSVAWAWMQRVIEFELSGGGR